MSDSVATYQSGRGPSTRNPLGILTADQVVKLDAIPRTNYTTGGTVIKEGLFVSAKKGVTLNFFEDSAGLNVVGPSGGSGGQSGNPSRSNGEAVGVTTGLATNTMVQVQWVNTWWQDAQLKTGAGWNPVRAIQTIVGVVKGGEQKSETKVSWVKLASVDISEKYTDPAAIGAETPNNDNTLLNNPGGGNGSGLDTTTLGYAAIAGALIFSMNKKKRK